MFLVGAVVVSRHSRSQEVVSIKEVERLTVVALVVILFDGGLHIGARGSALCGTDPGARGHRTFATAGLVAVAAHYLLGFDWMFAGLIGAAIAPTDPPSRSPSSARARSGAAPGRSSRARRA